MSANSKVQQRNELFKTIWSIADDLRGSVDGWDFKQYVLTTLFYRFISENLCAYLAEQEGDPGFDYSELPDEQAEYGRKATVEVLDAFDAEEFTVRVEDRRYIKE